MTTTFVVMGHEFYSSWPVRVFLDRGAADAFCRRLTDEYAKRIQVTPADRERAESFECSPETVAEQRASGEMRDDGLDPNAGGLELGWSVVEVPKGDPT